MAELRMHRIGLIFCTLLVAVPAARADDTEFFEKKIRPLLVENCYKCHSATSEKLKGGFRLYSKELALKGCEAGKFAIVPGEAEKSLLIEAVRYTNTDLQMPPKKKLSQQQIDDLTAWVKMGAPWPADGVARTADKDVAHGAKKSAFDLKERAKHWSFQPLQNSAPPQV